jgi:hypothetical protein
VKVTKKAGVVAPVFFLNQEKNLNNSEVSYTAFIASTGSRRAAERAGIKPATKPNTI